MTDTVGQESVSNKATVNGGGVEKMGDKVREVREIKITHSKVQTMIHLRTWKALRGF